ncbi:MAG: hypothetical protein U0974_10960 [Gemmatimonadales bacterium]|nr:hypothetical protein [Gemmatimonadales bacterium]MDZ4390232.1 hypothetical protein [Gemmatimonadales bacterium]
MMPSSAVTDAARRLWTDTGGDSREPAEIARVAGQLGTDLRTGLGRWIGADAYQILQKRAIIAARASHPSLDGISRLGEDAALTITAVRVHGAPAVVDGIVALVAQVIELLGRIIGQETAIRLVEQCGAPRPHEVPGTASKESTP